MSNRRCRTGVIYEVLFAGVDSPADFGNLCDFSKLTSDRLSCNCFLVQMKAFSGECRRGKCFWTRRVNECSLTGLLEAKGGKECVLSQSCNVTEK